jgi:phage-related protein
MTTLMELAVRLVGDIGAYKKSMQDAEQTAQQAAKRIGKDLQEIGSQFTNVGKNMTAAITLPVVAAGLAAVNAASDLEETKNKVRVVFGEMGDSVLGWSQDSAMALGQSKNDALSAAATFGNLFVTMGQGQKDAAAMSTNLVKLASDLGSFNNADPSEVMDAIRSGLIGQAEPLRKYGVLLTEAAVKAKAVQMGLAGADDELSEGMKLQARYAIILEQTRTAQGDFAKTADGLANSQRILKAQFADAAAQLGTQLLPYALRAVQVGVELLSKFQALSPETQKWILIIAGIAAAIGPVLIIVGTLISTIGAIIPVVTAVAGALTFPLIAVIAAVVAVVALLAAAWANDWGGIREKTQMAITFIQGIIQAGLNFIHNWWMNHGQSVMAIVHLVWNRVTDIIEAAAAFIKAIWDRHGPAITAVIMNTWQIIVNTVTTYLKVFGEIFDAFAAAFRGDWRSFGEHLRKAWDLLWKMLGDNLRLAWSNIKIIFGEWWRNIKDFFAHLDMAAIGQAIVDGIVNGLLGGLPKLIATAKSMGQNFMNAVKGFFGIHSPALKPKMEIGWRIGEGTGLGVIESIQAMLPRIRAAGGSIMAAMSPNLAMTPVTVTASTPAVAGAGGGAGSQIILHMEYKPVISTADQFEVETVLGPAIIKKIRDYLNK